MAVNLFRDSCSSTATQHHSDVTASSSDDEMGAITKKAISIFESKEPNLPITLNFPSFSNSTPIFKRSYTKAFGNDPNMQSIAKKCCLIKPQPEDVFSQSLIEWVECVKFLRAAQYVCFPRDLSSFRAFFSQYVSLFAKMTFKEDVSPIRYLLENDCRQEAKILVDLYCKEFCNEAEHSRVIAYDILSILSSSLYDADIQFIINIHLYNRQAAYFNLDVISELSESLNKCTPSPTGYGKDADKRSKIYRDVLQLYLCLTTPKGSSLEFENQSQAIRLISRGVFPTWENAWFDCLDRYFDLLETIINESLPIEIKDFARACAPDFSHFYDLPPKYHTNEIKKGSGIINWALGHKRWKLISSILNILPSISILPMGQTVLKFYIENDLELVAYELMLTPVFYENWFCNNDPKWVEMFSKILETASDAKLGNSPEERLQKLCPSLKNLDFNRLIKKLMNLYHAPEILKLKIMELFPNLDYISMLKRHQ